MNILKGLIVFVILIILMSCQQSMFIVKEWQLVGSEFSFPEGPAWDSKEKLYVSNCYGNWIAKIQGNRIDTLVVASDSTFEKTNGLFVSANRELFACDFGSGAILKINESGQVEQLLSGYQGEAFNRPNDLIVLKNGDMYFTDPKSYGKDKLDGRLFFYNADTKYLLLAADSLAFPNGLAISPNDKKIYLCESAKNQIVRFEIIKNGILTKKEKFIELPGGDPDGIDFDINGNLYVAHFGSGNVFVISPEGKIIESIKTPGNKPSNIEFGDSDLRTLYLTEDETNSVYKTKVLYPGYKLSYSGEK